MYYPPDIYMQGYPKGKGYVQFSHPTDACLARKVGPIYGDFTHN